MWLKSLLCGLVLLLGVGCAGLPQRQELILRSSMKIITYELIGEDKALAQEVDKFATGVLKDIESGKYTSVASLRLEVTKVIAKSGLRPQTVLAVNELITIVMEGVEVPELAGLTELEKIQEIIVPRLTYVRDAARLSAQVL